MPAAGAIKAGQAYIEVLAKQNLQAGLNQASATLKSWADGLSSIGTKMFAVGASVVGSLAGMGKVFASQGAELAEMSTRTGVSVEALSKLKYAASMTGVEMSSVETGLKRLSRTLMQAADGSTSAQKKFAQLGVDWQTLRDLTPEQQLSAVANILDTIPDPTERAAAAMQLLGKSGTDLLPMFEGGAAGLALFTSRGEELGLVMSGADATAAQQLNQRFKELWMMIQHVGVEIGASLVEPLTDAALWIMAAASTVTDFIKTHREFIVDLLKGAAVVTALGVALIGLAKIITAIQVVVKAAAAAFKFLTTAEAIAQAFSGPAGWITLAAAVGVAAGAIYGINKLMEDSNGAFSDVGSAVANVGAEFDKLKEKHDSLTESTKKFNEERQKISANSPEKLPANAVLRLGVAYDRDVMRKRQLLTNAQLEDWYSKSASSDDRAERLKDIFRNPTMLVRTTQAMGLFNAAFIRQLNPGMTSADRALKAQEDTARNTGKIADKLDDMDELAFE